MNNRYRLILHMAIAILLPVLAALGPPAAAQESSDEDCLACHEDLGKQFETNVHARIAGFEIKGFEAGCQSCHGDG
jgi:hypothetical protein